ncbi:LPXTG cell wall anchor domain-containing protein [Enterococcus faecalis]|nr:LPXTG cell wall anchor domain-containing protein [Enterococcus faecalis]
MKKNIMNLLLVISLNISLSFASLSVFAEETESKVTVKIIHDDTIESEKSKESTNDSSNKENKESSTKLNEKNRLPQTNEHINSYASIIGILIFSIGIVGIYINNKRNGANNNEKE